MTINEEIGYNLTVHRAGLGLSQQQVADMLKMSRASVVNIEAGRQGLSVKLLYQICAALGVRVFDVLPERNQTV